MKNYMITIIALSFLGGCNTLGNKKQAEFVHYNSRPIIYDLHPVRIEYRALENVENIEDASLEATTKVNPLPVSGGK